jgi:DNA polymerase-3 subunit delta
LEIVEFLKKAGTLKPSAVYLFCPYRAPNARESTFEPLLAQRGVDKLVERFVEPDIKDLIYSSYLAVESDPAEIASVARTVPFLAEYRVVVVQGANHFETEKAGEPLLAYLESPCESTILILVAPTIDRRLKLYRLCDKAGSVVTCAQLRKEQATAWARVEIKARGKSIEPKALEELIARSGARLGDVNNAIVLVCNYVGHAPEIREEDVVAACADVAEEQVWALTDAIAEANTEMALHVLRALTDSGKNEFEILGTVTWMLKTAYFASGAARDRVSSFQMQRFKPLADRIGRQRFKNAFALCMKTEVLFRSTGVDRGLALELLVLKLARMGRNAQAASRR